MVYLCRLSLEGTLPSPRLRRRRSSNGIDGASGWRAAILCRVVSLRGMAKPCHKVPLAGTGLSAIGASVAESGAALVTGWDRMTDLEHRPDAAARVADDAPLRSARTLPVADTQTARALAGPSVAAVIRCASTHATQHRPSVKFTFRDLLTMGGVPVMAG